MSISTLSIKRPVLAIVMNLLIMLFGIIGYNFLGVREFPSVDPPIVNVSASYPGANADIIESQITEPLEKALNSVEGIRSVSSSSNQGRSNITVEFNLGMDMEKATNDVRDKVNSAVGQLPRDLDGVPIVRKADANSDAILAFYIQSDKRNILEMSDFAENTVAPRLETIEGVSEIRIWGMKRYAMRIWMNPNKMAAFGVTTQDVRSALERENVELPSGKLQGAATELVVKTIGRFQSVEDFNNMIVRNVGETNVRLRDIGYAELGPENLETSMRLNGVPMNGIAIQPQPGANYLDIAEEAYKRKAEIEKTLPDDISMGVIFDTTTFIKQSVTEVAETILIAIVLVVIIIFLFFRDWIVAFRPLIDIPVSLVGTFFIMFLLGFSVNVLTLLAIVLATGLVVDDGIVVTENIYKKIEEGMNPIEASIKGSNEIIFAVISTSITLAAVFLPVIFMEGFVGKLFMEFGVVLASAVLISAFVSLTLTPMLNAYLNRKEIKRTRFYEATEPYFEKMETSYRSSLSNFLHKKWIVAPIMVVVLALLFFFGSKLNNELAPLDDRSSLSLNFLGPEGFSYEAMDSFISEVTQVMRDSVPEIRGIMAITSPGFGGSGGANTGFGRIMLTEKHERTKSQDEIANYLTNLTKKFTVGRTFINQQQTISVNRRGGLPVGYVIQTPDLEKMREYLPKFMEKVENDPTFPISTVDLKFTKPELSVHIDREKAKSLGVAVADVAQTMNLAFAGQRFSYFTMNGRQYQVIGQFEKEDRNAPLDLKSMHVKNSAGELIQMDNIVTVVENSSPPQLYHYDRYMSATVTAGLAPGKTISDGIKAMDAIRDELNDPEVRTALTGSSRDFAESSSNTLFSFGLALILVYLILAAQFESFVDPLIIMCTVPLAIAGAVLSLWLFDQTINIFSQIGMIMLIGLVTKNGILIVEFANQLRERGLSKAEAALEAAVLRLRPILMTTLATAFGALPIAAALGAAGTSRRSMGIVVIGGLVVSLILTLYVIPAMYIYWSKEKNFERMKAIDEMAEA
ncbi:acriflavin resistance protein [Leadbetterella byssophila DSM 17132]|uniref:Acriflavin resistance protein n=1 Tax=Leadbetterella byssophila (strain DSM 17132 / JCM 16389 / KACC 11308 / NBRC 106382 / 4M15) TaxID=649349 RepID=E4RUB4_LEAB4|nr:efflux RND transporter permease subunit [Leadbetterella byssophila]ADQ16948.1 acriflavin resistance protein [Leadbetterella byssophila DSM 17132]